VLFLGSGGLCSLDLWDFQALAYVAYANLTTIFMAHLTGSTRSKYAVTASARLVLLSVFMEVLFTGALLVVYAHVGGYSLDAVAASEVWLIFALPALGSLFFIYAIFEAKRAPFDHTEAESELVAGHLVEFGGRTLLIFFICEYTHVYFCVFTLLVFVFGGQTCLSLSALWPGMANSIV
jgi:NADH-quinone oxidoreductase subunit H